MRKPIVAILVSVLFPALLVASFALSLGLSVILGETVLPQRGERPSGGFPGGVCEGEVEKDEEFSPNGAPVSGTITATFLDPDYKQRFGFDHYGIDVAPSEENGAAKATISGRVVERVESFEGYGHTVAIENEKYKIRLAHLKVNTILVSKGDEVEHGDSIGIVDNTGLSTGTHLHYEVYYLGQGGCFMDPLEYL